MMCLQIKSWWEHRGQQCTLIGALVLGSISSTDRLLGTNSSLLESLLQNGTRLDVSMLQLIQDRDDGMKIFEIC
jgi:hypothetical protein